MTSQSTQETVTFTFTSTGFLVVVHKPIVFPYVDTSLKRGLYETVRF